MSSHRLSSILHHIHPTTPSSSAPESAFTSSSPSCHCNHTSSQRHHSNECTECIDTQHSTQQTVPLPHTHRHDPKPTQHQQQNQLQLYPHITSSSSISTPPSSSPPNSASSSSSSSHVNGSSYSKQPITVTVTGAAGNIAYSLLWQICSGQMLGADQPIILRLLEIPRMVQHLKSVIQELQDSCLPLLYSIVGTTDFKTAFHNTQIALLLGGKPKIPGIKRRALLQANSHIFTAVGQALDAYADRNVKTIVLATPALTNALICQSNAPSIPVKNFTALTRLDQNRAMHQLAARLNVHINQIKNVAIMGNGSKTQLINICNAYVDRGNGKRESIREAVSDDKWLSTDFVHDCVERGHAISRITKKTTAGSAATATIQHVRDWLLNDTAEGEYVSMAVRSDGSYNIPKDIFFSFPVQCKNGEYSIVQGLQIDEFGKKRINDTIKELMEEKNESHLF